MSNKESQPERIRPGMLYRQRYRIEEMLDRGGMATIYLAVDEDSDTRVALKVLFERYTDNTVVRARFLDEGRIQARLEHPNIVHVHRIIPEPVLSFVMEYIEGETLEDYLQREAPLDENEIVDLFMPVMSGIGFAHNQGIVHRDLKPSNVLLAEQAGYLQPKIMDFGVAKVSRGKELTADGSTVGTLHYMSPEQIVGASDIDGRADIYSLGCSLYKLCTGEVPFNASSEFALMMAQVEAPPKPPSELRPELSDKMNDIILTALAKEREDRFQSIKEMTSELMSLGGTDAGDDTITRPIPTHLLEFAMEADEVARDQTNEMRLAPTTDGDNELDVEEDEITEAAETHELSESAVRKIERDRQRAARRKSGPTRSLPRVDDETSEASETLETEEFRPDDDTTTREHIDDDTTRSDGPPDDAELPTTTEQPRLDLDDSSTSPKAESDDRPPRSRDPDRRGIIAVDDPDVDSREVTDLLERDALEKQPSDTDETPTEELGPDLSTSPERPGPEKLSERSDSTTPQRTSPPSRRRTDATTDEGSDTDGSTSPERPALDGISDRSDSTTPQRTSSPSRRRTDAATDEDSDTGNRGVFEFEPPTSSAGDSPAQSSGSDDSIRPEPTRPDSSEATSSREQLWIRIGIAALLVALVVGIGAFVL